MTILLVLVQTRFFLLMHSITYTYNLHCANQILNSHLKAASLLLLAISQPNVTPREIFVRFLRFLVISDNAQKGGPAPKNIGVHIQLYN